MGPDHAAIPLALILWFPTLFLLDRALVLEQHGIRYRQCGHDLRGQADPYCPECGRQFGEAEMAQMKLLGPSAVVQLHRRASRWWWLLYGAILIALILALVVLRSVFPA